MKEFPIEFKTRMEKQLGHEWPAFVEAHAQNAPVSIRVNARKSFRVPDPLSPVPWCSTGYYLPSRPVFTLDPFFHAGCYYVQEASSMFLEQAFRQHVTGSELRVLDLCAAPGGKSTHLLSLLDDNSLLVANEVIRSRVSVLTENIQKWGSNNVVVTNNDPSDFTALTGCFDVIVIDAPCSGEGLFRKDPLAVEHWSDENVKVCEQRQRRILDDVWPALKENGILIYSTCTYNPGEDEELLAWAVRRHQAKSLPLTMPIDGVDECPNDGAYGYRCYPHRVKGEGFFIGVLQKQQHEDASSRKQVRGGFAPADKKLASEVESWHTLTDSRLIRRDDLIQLLPSLHADFIFSLTQQLRVAYAGTYLATVKHNKLVPEHTLAMSVHLKKESFIQTILDEDQALAYLRRELANVDHIVRGFSLAMYEDVTLGWMNLIGSRINNLYPQEWRIRMNAPSPDSGYNG